MYKVQAIVIVFNHGKQKSGKKDVVKMCMMFCDLKRATHDSRHEKNILRVSTEEILATDYNADKCKKT